MDNFFNGQLGLFLMYIAGGILICLTYDIFRALRKSIKTSDLATYIEDIIFFIIVSIFLIYLIFIVNDGSIRGFIFIGLILGGVLYYFTLSKYFMKISIFIFTFLKKILLAPIRLVLKINKKLICFICINIQNLTKVLKKLPKLPKNKKKITKEKGF